MRFNLEEAIDSLNRTPAVLSALVDGRPDAWLHCREGEETFTTHEVIGHFVYGEQTDWIPRARIILESGEARPFDPFDRRGHEAFTRTRSTGDLLCEFAVLRAANVETLRGLQLDEAALDATGTHPELGRVTMRQLISCWVVHDFSHIAQIVRVMAKNHAEEVGPWRAYLTIAR